MFKNFHLLSLLAVLPYFLDVSCWASACCARTSSAPTLILGDDESQFNFGMSIGNVVAEADGEGAAIFGSPQSSEMIQTFRLDGATLLSDRFQMGLSVSIVRHSVTQSDTLDSTFGQGDSRLSLAYEILPSWNYSQWKPQGFLFSVVTLPTGRSVYESASILASDVIGNGFFSATVGSVFLKRWNNWDVFLMPEIHYSLPRTFSNFGREFQVVPGFGGSAGVGGGLSPWGGDVRIGLRIQPRWDQARLISGMNYEPAGSDIFLTDFGIDFSYLLSTNDSLIVNYTDQTLLGPAMNSNLNRILGINYQHRWER